MNLNKYCSAAAISLAIICASLAPVVVKAADSALESMSLKQRLERVERLVSSDVLIEQAQQNEMLREEITTMREQLEQQQHELDTLKQRQRSLYVDMDRRLTNVEAGAVNVRSSPVPPPNTSVSSNVPAPAVRVTSSTAGATGNQDAAKQAYGSAFNLLKEGRYAQSIEAFTVFLKDHAGSQYVDNAQYWLAEANYVSREYKTALSEFQKLIASHPDSTKIPGARLKIGYVYYELKNWSAAKEALDQVTKLYPDTTVAKKAVERLARIKREGH